MSQKTLLNVRINNLRTCIFFYNKKNLNKIFFKNNRNVVENIVILYKIRKNLINSRKIIFVCIKTSFQIINFVFRKKSYKRMLRIILQIVSFVIFKKILKRKCKICSSNNNKIAIFENVTYNTISLCAL